MREGLLSSLRCPGCRGEGLRLKKHSEDGREVREGSVECMRCGTAFPVRRGILDLLYRPSTGVRREIAAWESMRPAPPASPEERMRSRERLRALPMLEGQEGPPLELETWRRHGRAVFSLCDAEDWRGRRVLELGAGRCWLSARLARAGAEVVATDILEDDDIGLGCAEAFLPGGAFFERVLCDMQDLPFAAASFDAVVATATLHHSPAPGRLCEEIARVLAPGGMLLAANEPLRVPWRETPEEENRGAREGSYALWTWLRFLRQAGLRVEETRVGRDASLRFKALTAGGGRRERRRGAAASAAGYAAILALSLPRLLVRKVREFKAGRPMRPPPRDRIQYVRARLGLAEVRPQALAGEEYNWGPGWYPAEDDAEPFRWCGPRSRFLLAGQYGGSALVMELATFHPSPQADPVEVEVRVGKARAGSVHIDGHGWREHRLTVPGLPERRAVPVTLQVKKGYFRPCEMGLGEDRRLLGIACRRAWWES